MKRLHAAYGQQSHLSDSHDKIDINLHSDVSLGFKQNLSTTNAELGVLELLSKADADESNPDYEVNVSIDANESSLPSVSQSYNVDLNFELKNLNFEEFLIYFQNHLKNYLLLPYRI